jgi:membrane fusion protein (multidrug efflux system)
LLPLIFVWIFTGCSSKKSQAENEKPNSTTQRPDNSGHNAPDSPGIRDESRGTPVEVTPLVRGEISSYLLYNSTLETEQMADVYSRIPGLVEEIYVEEGKRVSRDQPLLQIEQEEYILEEEKARLSFDTQKSEFERFQALKDKNLISVEEFETARLSLRQAELQWKQAQLNLSYTTVRSPINGVIGERTVKIGDRIQTSTKLFVVANPEDKVVKVFVPQDELPRCYLNQKAVITTDVRPDQQFTGWVKRISPIVDPTSGTFKVTAGVRDPANQLRPGMFVSVRLIVEVRNNARLIPKTALVYENERTYFYAVQKDTVIRLELKKGFEDAEKVEILNAIPDSVKIVVVGQSGLKDGNQVEIVNEKLYPWQKKESDQTVS